MKSLPIHYLKTEIDWMCYVDGWVRESFSVSFHVVLTKYSYKIWGIYGLENEDYGLLGYDTM
jgi:hypothetical protein